MFGFMSRSRSGLFCQNPSVGVDPTNMSLKENRKSLHDFAYYRCTESSAQGLLPRLISLLRGWSVWGSIGSVANSSSVRVGYFSTILGRGGYEFAESLTNLEVGLEQALGLFRYRGFVTLEPSSTPRGMRSMYIIDEQKRANLEFYRNSLVNYLWSASFLSLLLTQGQYRCTNGISFGMREEFQLTEPNLLKRTHR